MDDKKIPVPFIGLLSTELSELMTHAEIDSVFSYADAPGDPPTGSKQAKVNEWLRRTNKQHKDPLSVLGSILEEVLEKELPPPEFATPFEESWRSAQSKINAALSKRSLQYQPGGLILSSSSTATNSLSERVSKDGLAAIQIEIERALALVGSDPNGASQYAGNVLEAALKHYLVARNIHFNENKEKITDLWALVRNDLRINPKDLTSSDLKKIASGLGSIVDGTMFLRDKKSGAHGRTQQQAATNRISPRHARLVIHAAHTLAMYVIECLDAR